MKTTLAILTVLAISLPTAVVAINTGKASTALPLPMSFGPEMPNPIAQR